MAERRYSPTQKGVVTARVDNYWRVTLENGTVEHMATGELNYDNVEVGDQVAVTYCVDGMLRGVFIPPRTGQEK